MLNANITPDGDVSNNIGLPLRRATHGSKPRGLTNLPGGGGLAPAAVPPAGAGPFRLSAQRCTGCGKRRKLASIAPGQEPCAEVLDRTGAVIFPAVPGRPDQAWCWSCLPARAQARTV